MMLTSENSWRAKTLVDLVRATRAYQRRNQFVDRAHDSPFSITEGHILIDVEGFPGIKFQELQKQLKLPKATLSQTIQKLVDSGIIIKEHAQDRRSSSLLLSNNGRKFLKKYHKQANDRLESFLKDLNPQETLDLTNYFERFSEGLNTSNIKLPTPAHPMRAQIARMTRGLGLISRHLLSSSKYSRIDWHILSLLESASLALSPGKLATELRLQKSTLSVAFESMAKRGLIEREKSLRDGRSREVRITVSGRSALEEIESQAKTTFETGLQSLSTKELERFLLLFRKLAGISNSDSISDSNCSLLVAHDTAILKTLRAFLIAEIYRSEARFNLPSSLFSEKGWSYGFTNKGEIYACLEFQKESNTWELTNISYKSELPKRELFRFIYESLTHFSNSSGISKIIVSELSTLVVPELTTFCDNKVINRKHLLSFLQKQ